jgi:hypothetical protein
MPDSRRSLILTRHPLKILFGSEKIGIVDSPVHARLTDLLHRAIMRARTVRRGLPDYFSLGFSVLLCNVSR